MRLCEVMQVTDTSICTKNSWICRNLGHENMWNKKYGDTTSVSYHKYKRKL